MPIPFLAEARQGRNGWRRYLQAISLMASLWLGLVLLVMLFSGLTGIPIGTTSWWIRRHPLVAIVAAMFVSGVMLAGLFLVMRRIHHRPFGTLFHANGLLHWRRVWQGCVFWLGASGITIALLALVDPYRYTFLHPDASWWLQALLFLLVSPLIAIAWGALSGYLLQAAGLLFTQPLWVAILWGLAFGFLDFASGRPQHQVVFTGLYQAVLVWVALQDNGVELLMGSSIAWRITGLLVAVPNDHAMIQPLFAITESIYPHPFWMIASHSLRLALFCACFRYGPWRMTSVRP
jgi:hypothetical protein